MIDALLSLPTPLGASIIVLAIAGAGVATYLTSYRLTAKYQTEETSNATSSLFRVTGILLSLFLSLTFAGPDQRRSHLTLCAADRSGRLSDSGLQ